MTQETELQAALKAFGNTKAKAWKELSGFVRKFNNSATTRHRGNMRSVVDNIESGRPFSSQAFSQFS